MKVKPETLPPHVLRTELPTSVWDRCQSAQEIAVWLALRWYSLLQRAAEFTLDARTIADLAKVDVKTVPRSVERLIANGTLEHVGDQIHPKLTGRGRAAPGAPKKTPILRIPAWIEKDNYDATEARLMKLAGRIVGAAMPTVDQLSFLIADPKTDQETGKTDQEHGKNGSAPDPKTDQHGRKEGGKEGGRDSPAPDQEPEEPRDDPDRDGSEPTSPTRGTVEPPPPSSAPPPPPPPSCAQLPSHPLELWRLIRGSTHTPLDDYQLTKLASDYDALTDGHGWHWVGEALLSLSFSDHPPRKVTAVRAVLRRWHADASWGSDTPAYDARKSPSHDDKPARRADVPAHEPRRSARAGRADGTSEIPKVRRIGAADQ